jgi:hypothetical protein
MPDPSEQRTLREVIVAQAIPPQQTSLDLKELTELALRGLVKMFDPDRKLFCFRLYLSENGLVREGYSRRYTMMSLLGLRQLESSGEACPINIKDTLQSMLRNWSCFDSAGDLGLLLWLCAEAAPEDLERICFSSDFKIALSRFSDARDARTMELAWLLSGLAHAVLARGEARSDLTNLTAKVFSLIRSNQGKSGIFAHLAPQRTASGLIRGRIGSFADQVYPIYALARLAQAYDYDEPLEMATKCAESICELQGPLGQWWWHYDSRSGKVFQRYPVYSVHQDGMAPMALFALAQATGKNYNEPINRGLQWTMGKNELNADLRDALGSVIWRCIFPKAKYQSYMLELLRYWGLRADGVSPRALSIKLECRPYHFGWLLFAFAPHLVVSHQAFLKTVI